MKLLVKIALTTLAVLCLAHFLSGINLEGGLKSALIVAIVLGLLNNIVAPILKFLTIPITIITLGLFLLFINAAMVMLADHFIEGFAVKDWMWALIFSIALSIAQWILYKIFLPKKAKK